MNESHSSNVIDTSIVLDLADDNGCGASKCKPTRHECCDGSAERKFLYITLALKFSNLSDSDYHSYFLVCATAWRDVVTCCGEYHNVSAHLLQLNRKHPSFTFLA